MRLNVVCIYAKIELFVRGLGLGADRFQDINAKYGRGYGDCVLKKMAENVESNAESKFQVFRTGGDCFGVNLVGYTIEQCKELYHKIQDSVASLNTFSAGAVAYPWKAGALAAWN